MSAPPPDTRARCPRLVSPCAGGTRAPAELARRIALRGQGRGWPQPGDPLLGQPDAHLRRVAAESAAETAALDRSGLGDLRIDTDGRTVADVADLIAGRW